MNDWTPGTLILDPDRDAEGLLSGVITLGRPRLFVRRWKLDQPTRVVTFDWRAADVEDPEWVEIVRHLGERVSA